MTAPAVSIIILSYNNLTYTRECLESIRTYTDLSAIEIIVVDNNSNDGSAEWLRDNSAGIILILNSVNEGFPRGCNQGIAAANPANDILLLNNDTLVTTNWLTNLQAALYSDPSVGAAGAVSRSNDNLQGLKLEYSDMAAMQNLAAANNISDPVRWEQKIFLIGFCILIKRSVYNVVGPLDEEYSPGYVEDNDYSLRIVKKGFRLLLAHDCYIHHYHGTEFRKDNSKFLPLLMRNRRTFSSKWGFAVFAFDKVRFGSMHVFDPPADKPLKVLDLECGIGVNLLKVKHAAPQAALYGIEPDLNMANISKHIAKVSARPLYAALAELPKNHFDYIFAGDTLSKSSDPERLINLIKRTLNSGGTVIGECPNAMHYTRLLSLISGTAVFESDPPDYIRHFTPSDIEKLYTSSGFTRPYIFHWFSMPSPEDNLIINTLAALPSATMRHSFTAHTVSYRFTKP